MEESPRAASPWERWLTALEERHLADFTPSEIGRALRALSSCYVERRTRLAEGAALDSAGKRAAFALYYAPLHFNVVRLIVEQLPPRPGVREVVDLGCGTGAAGAAWALALGAGSVSGFDRNPWAVGEAGWTYRQLGIRGRASRLDLTRVRLRPSPEVAILAAYTINELSDAARAEMLPRFLAAAAGGAAVLILEPIARRMSPWWQTWERAFLDAGGRSDEWRFTATLPPRQRQLAKSAGLTVRELTGRTLFAG